MLRVTSLHTPSREQPRFTRVTTLRSGFDKHLMSELHGTVRSSRASHEWRRPTGPGRARHSTRSLSRVYSRSMMLLLGKFGAPPGMLIYNGRRAIDTVDALASTRSPSLACRLSTRQHPHRPRTRSGASARFADAGSRGGARMQCCFRGFLRYPPPMIVGRPCMCALDGRALCRALGCPPRVIFCVPLHAT